MAQLINLGKLRFSYEGEYNPATEYETNQVVRYGANVYVYTATSPATGQVPTNTLYWTLMLKGIDFKGQYDNLTTYKIGDVVSYGGKAFVAIQQTNGVNPDDIGANLIWDNLVDGIQYEGQWSTSASYQTGDLVKYGGLVYIATDSSNNIAPTSASYWSVFIEGIDYKGAYNPSTEYNLNDIVTYDGSSWISIQNTTGNAPANSSQFWDILAPGTFPSFSGNEGYFLSNDGTNVVWASDIVVDSVTANSNLYIGASAAAFEISGSLTNAVAVFQWDEGTQESSFAQLAFQNADPTSSTDIIAYMDNGDDSVGWMGMGITGSQFDDQIYGITGPGDGYIFHNTVSSGYTGNIVIATGAEGSQNKIVFAAGGFDSGLTQMEITPDVNVHVEINTPSTSPETGAFTVVGGVGIQGDMNIQGDVNVVGTITFGGEGTTVATSNLAVDDPLIFAGNSNTNDLVDLGLIGGYGKTVSTLSASVIVATLSSNVATLTTNAAHGFSANDIVTVSGISASYDGNYIITSVPVANQFSYSKALGNISTASVSGLSERTRSRRYAGVVRDATDSVIKFFQDATTKPTSTVNFSEIGLTLGNIQASGATLQSITTFDITSTGSAQFTGGLSSTGANTEITGSATITGLLTLKTTINGSPIFAGDPVFTGTPAFTGGVRIQELLEDVVDVSHSSNSIGCDYSVGNIFFLTNTLGSNATVNVTNAPTDNGRVFTINIFVTQGSTGYIPETLNINGSGTTIKWAAGLTPTPSSSSGKIDIFTFTIIRRSSSWIALGSANLNF
jgi:hypothetical protein